MTSPRPEPPDRRWRPPSWAGHAGVHPNTLVKCRCGRRVPADALVDVRGVPAIEGEFACDGCVSRARREGRVTRRQLAEAAGAPQEVVERMDQRTRRHEAEQAAHRVRLRQLHGLPALPVEDGP